ncbi:hypothetical protein Taro_027291 [Colocasia esculenta]|uniref:Uncharacterized protein n=1 Tax=Colocasia esculenta TaxID=4460 RepID=A0A843VR64_COLES|nr:hypothetical protein [Colocasia esculenta]
MPKDGICSSCLAAARRSQVGAGRLNLETGIPIYEAELLLLFSILFTLLDAIGSLGDQGSFVDDPPIGIVGAVIPPRQGP